MDAAVRSDTNIIHVVQNPARAGFCFAGELRAGLPVAAVPAAPVAAPPTPMAVTPAPMTTAPPPVVSAPVPAHLFRLELRDFSIRYDRGVNIVIGGRQFLGLGKRLRRDRGGARGSGQRGRSGGCGEPHREFQKVSAFHDISLWSE